MSINKLKLVIIIVSILGTATFCSAPSKLLTPEVYTNKKAVNQNIRIDGLAGKGHNHPTFVIWQEDLNGKIIQTLFITKSYASGIFGHENVGDTAWLNKAGKSYQPAALPYWSHKKGLIDGKEIIPTPEHPYVDAMTGATPKTNFSVETFVEPIVGTRLLVEVNQTWDWNEYWTNDKYPNSEAYKHSAQPSIIYAVGLNTEDSVFYLNPIGHGDARGKTGKLFTNLSTLSSAKSIFKEIKVTLKK